MLGLLKKGCHAAREARHRSPLHGDAATQDRRHLLPGEWATGTTIGHGSCGTGSRPSRRRLQGVLHCPCHRLPGQLFFTSRVATCKGPLLPSSLWNAVHADLPIHRLLPACCDNTTPQPHPGRLHLIPCFTLTWQRTACDPHSPSPCRGAGTRSCAAPAWPAPSCGREWVKSLVNRRGGAPPARARRAPMWVPRKAWAATRFPFKRAPPRAPYTHRRPRHPPPPFTTNTTHPHAHKHHPTWPAPGRRSSPQATRPSRSTTQARTRGPSVPRRSPGPARWGRQAGREASFQVQAGKPGHGLQQHATASM